MRNNYTSLTYKKVMFNGRNNDISAQSLMLIKSTLLAIVVAVMLPIASRGQIITLSYSYENVTRNATGGNLEKGDIIEVHALMLVKNKTTKNVYYIDTIRTGTQYVPSSMKILTNEGVTFEGPYTDASNDDKAVYDVSGGTPRIRVNIGTGTGNAKSGVNLTSTSGGGQIAPGTDKPKFYGGTLLMVAYQLKVTANFGDTIRLTGNYYFDTSGTNRTYHFAYPGIKVIQNSGLCENFSSASFTADSSFGSGIVQNRVLPAIVPGYNKVDLGLNNPGDGNYSIANNTSADGWTDNTGPFKPTTNNHRVFGGFWDIIGDHTGAADPALGNAPVAPGTNGGYMLVVNAAFPTGEAFRQTISDLCPNTNYEFSAWVRNICGYCGINQNGSATYTPGVLPNLTFAVNDVDYYTSGDIPWDKQWKKRGFMYKTGPNETSFTISIRNNAAGGGGNDWVLDDIKLATCYPNLIMNPNDTAASCAGSPIAITDTVKSYFDNYNFYRWEKSTDGGTTWIPVSTGNTKTPTLINGLYVYHVDTAFLPVKADSGTFLRVKVATSLDNLTDGRCAVNNSQKVFLKVYDPKTCPILETKVLNFSGIVNNDHGILKWNTQNEASLRDFEIQKSTDGVRFYPIGKIAGNSGYESSYSFADPEAVSSTVYYRLKLVNSNNTEQFSKIISLYNRTNTFKVTAVNPFRNVIKLDVFLPARGNVEFNLCDIYGNVVNKRITPLEKGNSQLSIDNVYSLPAGLYILRASFDGMVSQTKLIKTN